MKFHHWKNLSGVLQNAVFFIRAAYRRKYLKRRVMYSYGHCGEAGNTTVIGTQLYFTSVQQRYKHGGHVERVFEWEQKTCLVLSRVVT